MNTQLIKGIDQSLILALNKLLITTKKSKPISLDKITEISFLKLNGIGDAVLLLPIILGVKRAFPEKKISVITTKTLQPIFYGQSCIDEIIVLNRKSLFSLMNQKKSLVIDAGQEYHITSTLASGIAHGAIGFLKDGQKGLYDYPVPLHKHQHVLNSFIDLTRPLKKKIIIKNLVKIKYSKYDKQHIDQCLKRITLPLLAINPGGGGIKKKPLWQAKNFAKVAVHFKDKYTILLTGSKEETFLSKAFDKKVISLIGKTTINQLACLYERCDVVLANDSGSMHIAAAMGAKTIGLFSKDPGRYAPFSKRSIALYHPTLIKSSDSYKKGAASLKKITVEEVIKAIEKIRGKTR